MAKLDRVEIGKWGEGTACAFLELKGYRIIERNYRVGHRELDIIARDGMELVFVEVKVRCRSDYGGPLCAIDWRKQRDLTRAAEGYLLRSEGSSRACRFDVIGIMIDEKAQGVRLRHIERAFDVSSSQRVFL